MIFFGALCIFHWVTLVVVRENKQSPCIGWPKGCHFVTIYFLLTNRFVKKVCGTNWLQLNCRLGKEVNCWLQELFIDQLSYYNIEINSLKYCTCVLLHINALITSNSFNWHLIRLVQLVAANLLWKMKVVNK